MDNVCGDGLLNMGVEACDDGNLDEGDGCNAACEVESCGDGVVQGDEQCDDGNDVDTDACPGNCLDAICGDGYAHEGVEACDDANDIDTDECTSLCVAASCGDGLVYDGVELCDDGNDVDTDACTSLCAPAACGDGFVQEGVEACDDGNLDDDDGCSSSCEVELKDNLLRCGNSSRNVADFIPMGVVLNVVASCTPDANTQAMLVSRSGVNSLNAAAVKAWVEAGGIVLTEYSSSDNVYNAVFQTNVGQVSQTGACYDRAPTVFQYNANDPFWSDNVWQQIAAADAGCGFPVNAYPGITLLAGWSDTQASIGYRNAGSGRVWVTEFDWQDTDTPNNASYAYTNSLMGYMITHGQ